MDWAAHVARTIHAQIMGSDMGNRSNRWFVVAAVGI